MDSSTWSRLRPILERALEHDGDEREAYLRSSCRDDERLLARARELLRTEEDPSGVLGDATPGLGVKVADLPLPGALLGPWRLERELGHGGMGAVWLATRADGEFEKRVALKLIRAAVGGEELLRRFDREQRLLAALDHPGIARLIDVGRDAAGRPFFVMEYVEGQPIDAWCREQGLSLRQRLELFRKVCAAVEHAHRRLVIHRDLKPANVLVKPDGTPKLLDFGIAKLLGDSADDTLTAELRYTPHYASPEQVRGELVGTQSDVYSLGVLLYELLTGERPYHFGGSTPTEILRVMGELDPAPPSAVSQKTTGAGDEGVGRWSRQLTGDLDAIVLFALRREPERRYGSVEALSADLDRFLEGLPVQARPDTLGYRTRKLLRRHGVSIGAVAALVLALLAGLVGTTYQFLRAERARSAEAGQANLARGRAAELELLTVELRREQAVAEENFEQVRRFSTALIFDIQRAIKPLAGATQARQELISMGLAHLDRLADQAGDDDEFKVELAAAYLELGDVLGERIGNHVGRTAEARGAYAKALGLARSTRDSHLQRHAGQPLLAFAAFKLADALIVLGEVEEARAVLQEVLASLGELDGPEASDADLVSLVALTSRLGRMHVEAGEFAAAERILQQELELSARLLRDNPGHVAALDTRAASLISAAFLAEQQGQRERSQELVGEAADLLAAAVEARPADVGLHRKLCAVRTKLAESLTLGGEAREALPLLDQTIAWLEEQVVLDPTNQQYARELAVALMHMGEAFLALGEVGEAQGVLEYCVQLAVEAATREPDNVDLHSIAAKAHVDHARALLRQGRAGEALEQLELSAGRSERVLAGAPGDPQRRRAVIVNLLEIVETVARLDRGGEGLGGRSLERGQALLAQARATGTWTPLDDQIEEHLARAAAQLEARVADPEQ